MTKKTTTTATVTAASANIPAPHTLEAYTAPQKEAVAHAAAHLAGGRTAAAELLFSILGATPSKELMDAVGIDWLLGYQPITLEFYKKHKRHGWNPDKKRFEPDDSAAKTAAASAAVVRLREVMDLAGIVHPDARATRVEVPPAEPAPVAASTDKPAVTVTPRVDENIAAVGKMLRGLKKTKGKKAAEAKRDHDLLQYLRDHFVEALSAAEKAEMRARAERRVKAEQEEAAKQKKLFEDAVAAGVAAKLAELNK